MAGVEEFTVEGKDFVYIDFSNLSSDKDFAAVIDEAMRRIGKHSEQSIYTITNVDNARFDSNIKETASNYMAFNKSYVKHGVIIGINGIKKVMVKAIMKISGRDNMDFCFSKEEGIKLLLGKN